MAKTQRIELRVSEAELAELKRLAAGVPLSSFILGRCLEGSEVPIEIPEKPLKQTKQKAPVLPVQPQSAARKHHPRCFCTQCTAERKLK